MNMNWEMLRDQKVWLLNLWNEMRKNPNAWTDTDREMLDGIINMIDGVQDYAIDNGNATEYEVFGS